MAIFDFIDENGVRKTAYDTARIGARMLRDLLNERYGSHRVRQVIGMG